MDLKGINPVDLTYCDDDAQEAIKRFTEEKVDAVLIINCNFGNEEIVAQVARTLGKPVCIWAAMDDSFLENGTRYTDSQCRLFGVSCQLQRFHISFSYIETCAVEDEIFARGLARSVSVTCMVKNLRGMRIAQVGLRPKPFCSVIFNEGELMEKFEIQIISVNLAVVIDQYNRILRERDAELEEGARLLLPHYEMDDVTPPLLKKVYAFALLYQWVFETYRMQAVHGIQRSGGHGVYHRLRKRSSRDADHGAAVLCGDGPKGSLLREIHRPASREPKRGVAVALRAVCR